MERSKNKSKKKNWWLKFVSITILSLFGLSVIIYFIFNYNDLRGAQGVAIGKDFTQNNNYFYGSGTFDSTRGEEQIYAYIVKELQCTYKINSENNFNYECNFHPIEIKVNSTQVNVSVEFPNNQRAFIKEIPANVRMYLGFCKNNYSECMIFRDYIYSEKDIPCDKLILQNWTDKNPKVISNNC
jgi:hypothetical protein